TDTGRRSGARTCSARTASTSAGAGAASTANWASAWRTRASAASRSGTGRTWCTSTTSGATGSRRSRPQTGRSATKRRDCGERGRSMVSRHRGTRSRVERVPDTHTMSPTVLIFRKRLLRWSETFIAAQGRALRRYHPVFVGYERNASGATYLDGCEQILLRDYEPLPGLALGKALLKTTGRVPGAWRRAIEATRPRLIHAHFATSAQPALRLAETLRVPLIMTFHGHDIAKTPRNRAHAERRRALFGRSERAVAVSDFIATCVREAGCPED